MNSFVNILLNVCKSSDVATAAGVSSLDWSLYHVFNRQGQDMFSDGVNIGRLPIVYVGEATADTSLEAVATNLYFQQGSFIIRIIVNPLQTDSNRSKLHTIKQAILKNIGTSLAMVTINTGPIQINPMGMYIDITIENESTQTNQFEE